MRGDFMEQNLERAEAIIDAYGCEQSNLIAIMQEIQGEYKYLSEGALTLIAEKLGISTAKVYSVATFYENFSLEAKGRHIIKVCTGTACHVRKSGPIYDALRDALGLTADRQEKDVRGWTVHPGDRGLPWRLRPGPGDDH